MPSGKRPTMRQVAKACGVSPMTVSYVLNDRIGEVGAETRERVLRTMRQMGYRPHARPRQEPVREVLTIGLIAAGVAGSSLMHGGYFGTVTRGILMAADDLGHSFLLFSNRVFAEDTLRRVRVYCDGRCDGLLVLAPHNGSGLVSSLNDRNYPFVLVGDTGDEPDYSFVDADNVGAGREAVEFLIAHGHRRIGFVSGADFIRSAAQRRVGYCQAMGEACLPVDPAWVLPPTMWAHELEVSFAAMMRLPIGRRPTALFAWNDGEAVHVMRLLSEMGFAVPRDISLIGFDDDPTFGEVLDRLTTVRQELEATGRRAAEVLVGQLKHEIPSAHREFMPTKIVVRQTVGPPPTL